MSDPPQSAGTGPHDHRRHGISAKIVLLVFLCTFSTALIISGIAVQSTYRELRAEIERGFPASLERSHRELSVWLAEGATSLHGLAGDRGELATLVAAASGRNVGGAKRVLAAFAERSLHFDAAGLLSADGAWIVTTPGFAPAELAVPLDAEPREQRASLASDPSAGLVVVPLDRGRPSAGFLAARLDRNLLETLLREERHEQPALLALTDAEGRVIAAIGAPEGERVDLGISLGRLQDEAASEVHEYASAQGVHSLGARRPISPREDDSWSLVVESPFTTAFAPMLELLTRVFVIDLIICVVFIAAAYRITTRMLQPIEDLSEGARKASSGDFGLAISDPGTHDEIGRLTRAFNEMMGRLNESQSDLQEANRQLQSRNEELQSANEVLSQLSITDGLTKLHNHRYFQDTLTREIKRQSRNGKPLSVLLVDLDDFKALNDRLGHASGDELLMRVASIMDTTVRESDLLARYGGEEFVVLATDTDLEGAIQLAEKIRMSVEQAAHIVNDSLRPVRITVSVGVAQYSGNRRRFFESADRALYRAKDQGKNCVVAATDDGPID